MKSNKKVLIFGNNDLANLLEYYLNIEGIESKKVLNKRYITDAQSYVTKNRCYAIEDFIMEYGTENVAVYLAVGYNKMNFVRKEIFGWLIDNGIEILTYIHPSCKIPDNVTLGIGNIFLEGVIIQPYVKIGKSNIFWANSVISHHCTIGDFNYFSPNSVLAGRVIVNDNCFLGANCTIKNDIKIDDACLIGAASYICCDLEKEIIMLPNKSETIKNKSSFEMNLL